jgi:hypothetical protein
LSYLASDKPGPNLLFLELCSSSPFDLEIVEEHLEAVYGIISLAYFLDKLEDEEEIT